MRTFTISLASLLMCVTVAAPLSAFASSSAGFKPGASVQDLQNKYNSGKVRILIAAGHEPGYGGAVYQGVYEREINVEVADQLAQDLEQNPKFDVIVTRDNDAWYAPLQKYFDKKWSSIKSFVKTQKKLMAKLVNKGTVVTPADGSQVEHTVAAEDPALRLYGINKWANENKIDLVVNLHVNDAADHGPNTPSAYNGYAIYVPDAAYGNSATSIALGKAIAKRLDALSNVSTLPGESAGVVPDQELIAIGANGTLKIPSVLVESGYITEPRFSDPQYRKTLTSDLAYQIYLALQDFFGDSVANPRAVAKLPTAAPQPVPVVEPVVATTTVTATVATTTAVAPAPDPVAPTTVTTTTTVSSVPATVTATTTSSTSASSTKPSTVGACVAFTKILMRDIKGADNEVKLLQTILAKDKTVYPEGIVNGMFGPATERAVQAFQKKHGIASSGTPATNGYGAVGPKTAKAILALCTPAT